MAKKVRSRRRPANITDENPTPSAQPTTEPDAPDHDDGDLDPPHAPAAKDPSSPDQNTGGAAASASAEEDRMELVYIMTVLNWTQEEIAQHFNVVPRTVRNWKKNMAGMTFGFTATFNAEMELERALIILTAAEVQLRNLSEDAAACSDRATVARCAKELARLAEQRIRLLERVGGFDRLKLSNSDTEDAGKRRAEKMFSMIEAIGASVKRGKNGSSSEDE